MSMPHPGAYTIQINEYQRALITRVLAVGAEVLKSELIIEPGQIEDNAHDEATMLVALFGDEATLKSNGPDCVNGFCL